MCGDLGRSASSRFNIAARWRSDHNGMILYQRCCNAGNGAQDAAAPEAGAADDTHFGLSPLP